MSNEIDRLAQLLVLQGLLDALRTEHGGYELVDHWQQGEFHHDVVVRVRAPTELPGEYLVVATNCNGGIKEVLCLASAPTHAGLWHWRCPDNPEFEGLLPPVLAQARTQHWFDPAELLGPNARSEVRPEFRERVPGGGWRLKP